MQPRKPLVVAFLVLSGLAACSSSTEEDASTSSSAQAASDDLVDLGPNPTGGPSVLTGAHARTWRWFSTKNGTAPYDAQVGLALFGWPKTNEVPAVVDGHADVVMYFERQAMNRNGSCAYGACISRLGAADIEEIEHDRLGAFTTDCWDPKPAPRPVECLDQYSGALSSITKKVGNRLEYYGLVLTPPVLRPWWDGGFPDGAGRMTVVTERSALGQFEENRGTDYEWQGQALGSKLLEWRRKSKPECAAKPPPGCCSQEEYATLKAHVDLHCHDPLNPLGKCNRYTDTCTQMAAKALSNKNCTDARTEREDACFGGGNEDHKIQPRDRWRSIAACVVEMQAKGCGTPNVF